MTRMIPGPALDKLPAPASVGVKIDVMRGGEMLALDVPVWDVVVDASIERTVQHQVSFTAGFDWLPRNPLDPLNNYGQRVLLSSLLWVSGIPYKFDQGWFQISDWEEESEGVKVTALDLGVKVQENQMTWPSSPVSGATLFSELQRLSGLPVKLEVPNRKVVGDFQFGVDRDKALADLCEAYNLQWTIGFDGYLHAYRPDGVVEASYSYHDYPIEAPRKAIPRRPNVVTATGEKTVETGSGDKKKSSTVRYSSTVVNDVPPFDIAGYGRFSETFSVESATDQGMVDSAAARKLGTYRITNQVRTVGIPLDPRIMLGATCAFTPAPDVSDQAERPFVGTVVAFSKPLDDPDALMRVDVEVKQ